MRVRTIRKHDNTYGDKFTKFPGKVYDHPSPSVLLESGVVEAVTEAESE